MDGLRLLRTVRHLKPIQVFGRLVEPLPRPAPAPAPAPGRRSLARPWAPPAERAPSLVGPARLRLLNEEHEVAAAAAWNDPRRSRLWLYNLHYFDMLASRANAEQSAWARALVERWIVENPPGQGAGWEPYPVSLRMVNWIKWALAGQPFEPSWLDSLAVQARWLERRIEWRLLGNHLIANAKALAFAGLFFDGPEAERWRRKGLGLMRRQLGEQVLADGGHFERSPMYHAIVLEDLLDLINLVRATGCETLVDLAGWTATAAAMRRWLAVMTHPDGEIGFFNDAAFGVAARPAALRAYAGRLGLCAAEDAPAPLETLPESGYVRMSAGDATALLDIAPIGPDHLPGHAHADTLSFELSLGEERVIVNGGVSAYGEDARRQTERSTASHSTVEIGGENSSEVWAGFRVGRRARPRDVQVRGGAPLEVAAAHDGYRGLPGAPLHRRRWRMQAGGLAVSDTIEAGDAPAGWARYHLAPGVEVAADAEGRQGVLLTPGGRRIRWRASGRACAQPSEWRPEFGVRLPTVQLAAPVGPGGLDVVFEW
ncbi:MAG TPA: alginate lyase family protein [Caulobacteraceae bacterium]|jgi:uncharacterized heparinase superfamily protein|nr:alginate lyase family protein [Caulobacteraceae bacterium]